MKFNIKEQPWKIAYLETTYLKTPSESLKAKGAPKNVELTESDNSTKWSPSYLEHVDSHFPNSPSPKSKKNIFKGAYISKPSPPSQLPKIIHIEEMQLFIHKYNEWIVDVKGDDNYDF